MKKDWLWDRRITKRQAKLILDNPRHPKFISLVSLLLSRKNTPQEVFRGYLKPKDFFHHWREIKSRMRRDAWNNPRIEFWQAIYEKLLEKYRLKGMDISPKSRAKAVSEFCHSVGQKLRDLRKQKNLTQASLAKELNISQQMISRIESGRENISLLTLKRIVDELGAKVFIEA